jgi:uncharacterized repeat protein (TIGR01451 family)
MAAVSAVTSSAMCMTLNNTATASADNATSATDNGSINCQFMPVLTKAFSPTTFQPGGTTTLTFTLTNPAGGQSQMVSFMDQIPNGLQVANIPNVGGTCPNAVSAMMAWAGSSMIQINGLQVPAGASSCTVKVDITNRAGQTNESCTNFPWMFTNQSSNIMPMGNNFSNKVTPSCVTVKIPT